MGLEVRRDSGSFFNYSGPTIAAGGDLDEKSSLLQQASAATANCALRQCVQEALFHYPLG